MTHAISQSCPLAEYRELKPEIDAAIARVLDSGHYVLGPEVAAFETEFAAYVGTSYALGLASGTDAVHLGLRALGIRPGDEVITTPHTATATVAAIEQSGATPVLAEIDADTCNLDPAKVAAVITPRTRAIVPVHLFGHPVELDALLELAERRGLSVLEDCAQAHGASYAGRRVGTFGVAAAFSFYPTKNLAAIGDGGMLVSNDPALIERARWLREYGWQQRQVSSMPGFNSRLDELQATILRVKLKHLERNNERRRAVAALYSSRLRSAGPARASRARCQSVFHLYVIRHARRDALRDYLQAHGVGTSIHYPVPIHLQPAYMGRLGTRGSFPIAEQAAREILSLPMYPQLHPDAVIRVADLIGEFDASGST